MQAISRVYRQVDWQTAKNYSFVEAQFVFNT